MVRVEELRRNLEVRGREEVWLLKKREDRATASPNELLASSSTALIDQTCLCKRKEGGTSYSIRQ